jgi:hypothetical protein
VAAKHERVRTDRAHRSGRRRSRRRRVDRARLHQERNRLKFGIVRPLPGNCVSGQL